MVNNNMIQNCHITSSDVTNAHTMLGPNLAGTRGKTVLQKPDRVVMDFISVPNNFLKLHKFVTLVADMIFVNAAPLLVTMPHGIKFFTVEHIPTHTAKQLSKNKMGYENTFQK